MIATLKKLWRGGYTTSVLIMATTIQLMGYFFLILFALTMSGGSNRGEVFAITAMIGAASTFVGMLAGFVFGIPRSSENLSDRLKEIASNPELVKSFTKKYQANTNLEQVSDWLTKILVGIGLTQFTQFRDALGELSRNIATSINIQQSQYLITGSIVFFGVVGFFEGYLLARFSLPRILAWVEDDAYAAKAKLEDLINLKLDLDSLNYQDKVYLKNVIQAFEAGKEYPLPEDFKPETEEHYRLLSLERKSMIRPREGGNWESGKIVELTPLAQEILNKVKKELSE